MKKDFVCKVATLDEIKKKFDYEIKKHPNDSAWVEWKTEAVKFFKEKKRITYIGILDGEIITEACVALSKDACQNSDGLVDEKAAYLFAFRTIEKYQGKGYFSKLYNFLENDMKKRGYTRLTLGVEPSEPKNIMIYFHYGFMDYVKTAIEYEPLRAGETKPVEIVVNYYAKNI